MVRTLQWFIFEQDFWVTAVNLPQLQNDSFYMNCETLWEIRYLMLDRFIDLHCDPAIQLPVQRAWKLCLYYGWDVRHDNSTTTKKPKINKYFRTEIF